MGACSYEAIRPQLAISREELLELIAVDSAAAQVECIFLGGSIAEGLGNPRSDVDVYLIVDSVAPFKAEEAKFKSLMLGDRIVAPTFFSTAAVADTCRRVVAGESVSAAEIDLLHRIRTGIPLAREEAFMALRSRLPEKELVRLLVRSGETMLANIFADVAGTLEAGDLPTCAFNSRALIDCAMDAYLAMRGDTLAREKWRYRKIERTLGLQDPLARSYLELASCVMFQGADATYDYVDKCLELYQQIETRLVAYALHPSFPAVLFSDKSKNQAASAGHPRRNPLVKMAYEPDGTLVLIERAPLFRLAAPHSYMWLTIDGQRSPAEGAGIARELARVAGHEPAGLESIYASCIAEWSSANLLVAE
jgi:predicted nucleotidyltransferase